MTARDVLLEVTYFNHQTLTRNVTGIGWNVNTSRRCLIIGHGVPREEIPLDNVLMWRLIPTGPDPQMVAVSVDAVDRVLRYDAEQPETYGRAVRDVLTHLGLLPGVTP